MAKKSTTWITIPDSVQAAAAEKSGSAKKPDNSNLVKNKFFWGIGFMVLLVATFAVLAPKQFSALLKGNLFESTGLPEGETGGVINPLNLLPTAEKKEEAPTQAETSVPAEETAPAPESEAPSEPAVQSEPVVQPQEQPTSVAVQPIATPEEVVVAPVGLADCGTDLNCLLPHLKDCSQAKGVFSASMMGQSIEANLEISGAEADNCITKATLTKAPQAAWVGKDATCKLAKGDYTEQSLQAIFADMNQLSQKCSGSAIDAVKMLTGVATAMGSQAEIIQGLLQQVQQLQNQKEQNTEMMTDLVNLVQQQGTQGVRPSAPEQPATTGQPAAVQPGFRTNPYRVSVSPEELLRQRMAGGVPIPTTQYAQAYQPAPSTPRAEGSPQTGPETIVLFMGFLALVGWKFMRTFAKA